MPAARPIAFLVRGFSAMIVALFAVQTVGLTQAQRIDGPPPASPSKAGTVVTENVSITMPNGETRSYEVGTLFVPENRDKPSSRVIGVGFARFKATEPSSAPPMFLLPGGPGFSYLTLLISPKVRRRAWLLRAIERYMRIADLILVDQRGFSTRGDVLRMAYRFPTRALNRPALAEERVMHYREFAKAAVAQFEWTEIDLSGYTVKQCAHDVNDLRAALGYDKMTLIGTSFGSQWSFAVMRLHPNRVARALLSGVEPLDHGYDMPSYVFAALQRMWLYLEDDERFQPYLPPGGIAEAVRVVRDRLDREPLNLKGSGDNETEILMGPSEFSIWDPALVLELYHEHYDRWRKKFLHNASRGMTGVTLIGPLIDSSLGVTPQRRHRLWTDPATRYLGRRNFAAYLDTADIWPSPDVGDVFRTPHLSDIPVVFAQGDWDTSTPIENTFEIAPFFPNSRVLIAERGGHGVLGSIARERPQAWKSLELFLCTGDMTAIPGRVLLRPSRRFDPPSFPAPQR